MKKLICLSTILNLLYISLLAQSSITGSVYSLDNLPLKGCDVVLLQANDSQHVDHTTTDTLGAYTFKLVNAGSYIIHIELADYAPSYSFPFTLGRNENMAVSPVLLRRLTTNLEEVAVTILKSALSIKNGKITLGVENNPGAAGSTVLELLKRLPGVVVDAENNVSIDSKTGVSFLIDGRMQQLPIAQVVEMLSNMPAEAVDKIELQKNPPANYDAAGTAGLINIVLRKAKMKGRSGNITESLGIGRRFGNGTNAAFNFKSEKIAVFTNASYMNRNPLTVATMHRTLGTNLSNGKITADTKNEATLQSFYFKAGLEYTANPKTTAGLNITYAPVFSTELLSNDAIIETQPLPDYKYMLSSTVSRDRYYMPTTVVYLEHNFDTIGTKLVLTADYTAFDYIQKRSVANQFDDESRTGTLLPVLYQNSNALKFHVATQKLDFSKRFSPTLHIEVGFKNSNATNYSKTQLDRNDDGTKEYHTDSLFSNEFNYKEQIIAGYANLVKNFRKINFQTGLRAEQTIVNAAISSSSFAINRTYFNLFPNLAVGYQPNEKTSYQFSYSYRIGRPAYEQLIPIKVFNDQLNYGTGNPQLNPQYSHQLSLECQYNQWLFASISYTNVRNMIYVYPVTYYGSQVQVDTVVNFHTRHIPTVNLMLQKQLGNWYSAQLSCIGAYSKFSGTLSGEDAGSEAWMAFISLNNDFVLPRKIRLQVNGSVTTPYQDAIQRYAARGSLDLSIRRKFIGDKLNAGIGIYDIFYTDKTTVNSVLQDQSYLYATRNDTRRFRLTLTYNFGNMQIERKMNNDTEGKNNRIKNTTN